MKSPKINSTVDQLVHVILTIDKVHTAPEVAIA